MSESKIKIFSYVDESGNTGKNIFDRSQPDFHTAALVNRGDFDLRWQHTIQRVAQKVGADAVHANELGLGRLEDIASDLYEILFSSGAHFFVCRVEKKYLLTVKMFDVLFDSGENAAVAWHNYNIRPLKIILAFKLGAIITEPIAQKFWKCLLMRREEDSHQQLPPVCKLLKEQLALLPDKRSQEVLGNGLDWVIKHPEAIQFATDRKIAKHGHFPNLVAFTNLLRGLENLSKDWNRKIAQITHDEQSEFGRTLQTYHSLMSNADPTPVKLLGEDYTLHAAPGSVFKIRKDNESVGIQMADVALWLYGQSLKGKNMPPKCERLLGLILERGWHDDFSFSGVEAGLINKWGEVLFGPISDERLAEGKHLVEKAEEYRKASMAQFEADGLPPFMRNKCATLSGD